MSPLSSAIACFAQALACSRHNIVADLWRGTYSVLACINAAMGQILTHSRQSVYGNMILAARRAPSTAGRLTPVRA
jgi:hypothetical protein